MDSFHHLFNELRAKEPAIAYFCGLYSAQLAISGKEKRDSAQVELLLDDLSSMKPQLAQHPSLQSDSASFAFVLQFASRVFLTADDEERAGLSTVSTAQAFLKSAYLFEVLGLFKAELPKELTDRVKYAKQKAAEIMKRSKVEEKKSPTAPQPLSPTLKSTTPVNSTPSVKSPALPSFTGAYTPGLEQPKTTAPKDVNALGKAEKHARQAVSAIQFEDIATAREELEKALQVLEKL